MPILEVKDMYKSFGNTHVLKGVSFSIERGDVVSVIGASGNGKTTLLRCLTFLERAEKGMNERFIRILAESVISMESANNLIVIKTLSASAAAAAEAIDSLKWPEVLGTVAGDNTILVIVRSNEAVETTVARFQALTKR